MVWGYIGIMEKKMETTILGYILGVNCHVYLALCTVICLYPLSPFHLKHRTVQTFQVLPR